jgi:pilus assembly protein FimV
MARKLAAVAFSLGCLHASSLMALGLGEIKMESFLNEPLRASVDLLNMGGLHEDEVRVRLATTEDFDKLGLERAYFLTSVTFEVVTNDSGGAKILIRSEGPVLEPYLDFVVEARWPSGRLLREYTVLVDPPVFSQATPVVSASERVAATEGIPAPAKKSDQSSSSQSREDSYDYNQAVQSRRQRDYAEPSQGALAPGSRYRISQNQTLWEIASRAKPAGASVHQTMLDIQRLNPDAFINGNINRIKSGYIIYLPSADDISSADLPSALAEVREQNQAWREGRDEASYASNRPSLRISAEPEESAAVTPKQRVGAATPSATTQAEQPGEPGGSQSAPATGGVTAETLARLAALEEQLQTLQRIVSLKDDQIAALQDALKEAGGTVETTEIDSTTEAVAVEGSLVGEEGVPVEVEDVVVDVAEVDVAEIEEPVASEQLAEVAPAGQAVETTPEAKKPPTPPPVAADESWTSYLLYILGALVLAIAAFVFSRRRVADEDETQSLSEVTPQKDVFADVRLQDPELEVVSSSEEPEAAEPRSPSSKGNRGYGERKHDEYASDADPADALAEADIYIAYGRHPQAIDLLNNALAIEPGNPVYRLKLLEIYTELKNRVAAAAELNHIKATGDAHSIARAESIMERMVTEEAPAPELSAEPSTQTVNRGPGLPPNPLEILTESNESLEDNFSGLAIEDLDGGEDDDEELDLSADFSGGIADSDEDEDLVIAADSNALSTKLDLARAYLDMGDDEGARQILDEVVAEGSDDLKAEARTLLARIG